MSANWHELFPTKLTFVIFVLYMTLFIGQGIFVTASQETNNTYAFNTVIVVLLTEILKLIISVNLYCREKTFKSLLSDVRKDINVLLLYFVPALLYCLYNNLAFVNLLTFDPTTYYLLLQLRVVVTGILFQIIFKKYLTKRQWLSLLLLTIGCMLKHLNFNNFYDGANDGREPAAIQLSKNNTATEDNMSGKNMSGFDFSVSAVLIIAQVIFSCLAGVYNEFLLKDKGAEVNIFVQNVFMYLDSIVCNAVILLIRGELFDAFSGNNLRTILRIGVIIIIVNNAAIGIVTSFFLKYMNSILKTFASALELLFTAILCYFLFSIPIYFNTVLAIAVVSFAIYLYTQCPVVNQVRLRPIINKSEATQDKSRLLESESDADVDMDIICNG